MATAGVSPEIERSALCEFLDTQREALINKVQGLSETDARRAATVSSLSILSVIKHSAIWEGRWFQEIVAGRGSPEEWSEAEVEEVDPTFWLTDEDTVETVVAYYREQIAVSRDIVASFDLDAPCAWPKLAHRNLRWVALHMIEETARHAGHADIIRETIDGSRGP
ncbi:MAG: DinB family protein [Acidimicrobiales bacterium]